MNRIIKFRAYYKHYQSGKVAISEWGFIDNGFTAPASLGGYNVFAHCQFTGRTNKEGKDIYESDIFRVEENGDIDYKDSIYYLIITWVKEWCMFATLTVQEYTDYQERGIKGLDEPMFWTYTLEDTDSRKFFLCGNLHENPDLLTK